MSTIYTIGYEGTVIDRFVETLRLVGIQVLADVQAVPRSRKKGFSKAKLKARMEVEGISYIHFGELGDPKPGREAARAGQYDEFRRVYTEHLNSPDSQAALATLADIARERPTCLLCFERDPKLCHRSIVAERLRGR